MTDKPKEAYSVKLFGYLDNAKFQLIANTVYAALVENANILNKFVVEFLKNIHIKKYSPL